MQSGLKRETVYAVGELMLSSMHDKNNAKLERAPDALHSCKFCHACGGDWHEEGACDYFHAKRIVPPSNFRYKHWELHPTRISEVPAACKLALLAELKISQRVRDLHYDLEESYEGVRKFQDLLESMPPYLTIPAPVLARFKQLRETLLDTTFLGELESAMDQQEGP